MQEARCFSGALFAKERYFPWALFGKKNAIFLGLLSILHAKKRCRRDLGIQVQRRRSNLKRSDGLNVLLECVAVCVAGRVAQCCSLVFVAQEEFKCKGDVAI